MTSQNPKINGTRKTVQQLLTALHRFPSARFTVAGSATIPVFNGGPIQDARYHYQGIAPFNLNNQSPGNGIICASSTEAYFSLISQDNQVGIIGSGVGYVVKPETDYFHAGGIQTLGGLLPIPLESSKTGKMGLVSFYDVSGNPAVFRYKLTTPSTKASATAITTYRQNNTDYALLFVYQYDNFQMYIYRAAASAIDGTDPSVWSLIRTYSGDAFNATGISGSKQYQSFALVTQENAGGDTVFLIGFRGDEVLVLWSINLTSTPAMQNGTTVETTFGEPTEVTQISGWEGANWENGVGLQIRNHSTLRIYATDSDPTGTTSSYRFNFYVYG